MAQSSDDFKEPLSIAYLILVHRFPEQFKRLFQAIYEPNNYYLIHIDKKADENLYAEIQEYISDFQNTFLLESESIVWGGYSMVQVELDGIKKLLELGVDWDFFINLSGQDFPLRSQDQIRQFLTENIKNNYLKIANQLLERPDTMNRIENYFEDNGVSVSQTKTKKRAFMENMIPYIGGQWMILTRNCCEFICNSLESEQFEEYYKNTLIADESFFQTLLMNSSFDGTLINDDLRSIIWIPDGNIKLRPKTFTKKDLVFLSLKDNLFARKFDDTVDGDIINRLILNFDLPISQ